jgi:uncharacterized membrane protein YeaQ/YmgE (transglycosylase-associated protein family)
MTIWDIIGWLIIGALAGWLAGVILGRGGFGLVGDIAVGLVGAFIGSLIARLLNIGGPSASDPFSWASLIFALIGAIILVAILRVVAPGKPRA